MSALVLAIGLANAGTLLVVRAARRRRDVAIRTALGASLGAAGAPGVRRGRVVAVAATAVSLMLAPWLDEAVRRVLFPGWWRQAVNGDDDRRGLCAGVLAAIVAAVANLWQLRRRRALRMSAPHPAPVIRGRA